MGNLLRAIQAQHLFAQMLHLSKGGECSGHRHPARLGMDSNQMVFIIYRDWLQQRVKFDRVAYVVGVGRDFMDMIAAIVGCGRT